jgi:hypothetical protein
MFEDGARGIQKAREEAEKLGQSFDDEQLRVLAEADDAVKRLKSSWEAFATALTVRVAPAISSLLDLARGDTSNLRGGLAGDMGKDEIIRDLKRQVSVLRIQNGMPDTVYAQQLLQAAEIEARIGRIQAGGNRGTVGGFRGRVRGGVSTTNYAAIEAEEEARTAADAAMKAAAKESEKAAEAAARERHRAWELERDAVIDMHAEMEESVADALEAGGDRAELMGELALDEIVAINDAMKDQNAEMTVFTEQAARNMQDAFADFLFDPFQDGLKGMLAGFIDVIRRMVAEAAAAKIFGSMGGVEGVGASLGSLLGFANGGSFKVGGAGGTDSQLVAFKATPGEMVDVRTPGQSRGSGSITINVDARGAQQGVAQQLQSMLPAVIREAVNQSLAVAADRRSRGYA